MAMQLDETKENARKLATDNENLKYALQRAETALKASIPNQVGFAAAVYIYILVFSDLFFWSRAAPNSYAVFTIAFCRCHSDARRKICCFLLSWYIWICCSLPKLNCVSQKIFFGLLCHVYQNEGILVESTNIQKSRKGKTTSSREGAYSGQKQVSRIEDFDKEEKLNKKEAELVFVDCSRSIYWSRYG